MKNILCPVCNSPKYNRKSNYKGKEIGFIGKKLFKCKNCNILSMYPMPTDEELNKFYNTYYKKSEYESIYDSGINQANARFDFFKLNIYPKTKILKILDIGAGFGFIKLSFEQNIKIKENKIIYDVIEISPFSIDYLRNKIKATNIFSDLKEAKGTYNIIILSHILEHLIDPLSYLKNIKKYLENDGLLFIEVPNKDYLWKKYNQPHLIFFNPDSLKNLVELSGFNVIKMDCCGELIKNKKKSNIIKKIFKIIKKIFKKILNTFKLEKSINTKTNNANKKVELFSTYGPKRRWIRLLAKKK